jgi:hypothetical protein
MEGLNWEPRSRLTSSHGCCPHKCLALNSEQSLSGRCFLDSCFLSLLSYSVCPSNFSLKGSCHLWLPSRSLRDFFFSVLGLELRISTLSHSTSPFLWRDFQDRVSRTIGPGWLQTKILLISTSWAARITGMSHWRPAEVASYWPCFSVMTLNSSPAASGPPVLRIPVSLGINQKYSLLGTLQKEGKSYLGF